MVGEFVLTSRQKKVFAIWAGSWFDFVATRSLSIEAKATSHISPPSDLFKYFSLSKSGFSMSSPWTSISRFAVIALIVLSLSVEAQSAETKSERSPSIWKQAGDGLASPLTTDAKYVLIAGSGMTLLLLALSDGRHEVGQHWLHSTKPLGEASQYGELAGQLIPNAVYFVSMASLAMYNHQQVYRDRASLMLQSTLYAGVATTALKYTIREIRPDSDKRDSFPSGHTTTAFAFASAVAMEHEWYYGVPAYMLATLTGLSRVNDGRHYVHDVVSGATIGIAYGMGVYYTMKRQQNRVTSDRPLSNWQLAFLPDDHLSGGMFNLNGNF